MRLLFLLFILISCESKVNLSGDSPTDNVKNGADAISFALGDLVIDGITENDFSVSLGYIKDNSTYTAKAFYCNETDSAGCDPETGSSFDLTVTDTFFYGDLKNLSSPNDPTDTLNIKTIVYKSGTPVSSKTGTVTLKDQPSMILSILSNADDGETSVTSSSLFQDGEGGEQLYIGNWNPADEPTWGFFRFRLTKEIPDGATIKSVIFRIRGVGTFGWNSNAHYLNIYLHDSDNSNQVAVFNDTVDEANGNLKTNAVIRWPTVGGLIWNESGQNASPDLSEALQELIDKYSGLSQNNYIQLWINSPNFGTNSEVLAADTGHANFDTTLEITWEY